MSSSPLAQRTNGKAIASLVLSILGLVGILPILGSLLGILLGHLARGEIARHPEATTGEGLAQAGVILGWVGLALNLLGIICALAVLGSMIGLGICTTAMQESSRLLLQIFLH